MIRMLPGGMTSLILTSRYVSRHQRGTETYANRWARTLSTFRRYWGNEACPDTAYCATKRRMIGFTRALALELVDRVSNG